MDLDVVVARMEAELLPRLEVCAHALRSGSLYSEVRVASIRHAEMLHAIGIACVPKWSSDRSEYLSLCAKIAQHEELVVRIDVSWGQSFRGGTSQGYVKKEDRGRVRRIKAERDIEAVFEDWGALEERFEKVATRGKPTSRLIRFLRGAPRDLSLIPKEANQALEPTAPSGRGSS
jgi:hypothetical protein